MNTDIRLAVGFWQHPKTKKTAKHLGLDGVRSLQILWLWAAVNRPDGNLVGMDAEDIELAADWHGEDGTFISFCLGIWIDESGTGYSLHDWADHNSWQAKAKDRSETARKNANARWGSEENKQSHQVGNAEKMQTQCESDAVALQSHQIGNAPSPSPSPSPKPSLKQKGKIQESSCQGSGEPDEQLQKKSPPVLPEESEAYRLAVYMRDQLRANLPTLKEPDLQKWARDFDVALRNDSRMSEARFVATVIQWVAKDPFWRGNCQSPGKLREKFDQLTAKMEAEAAKNKASPGYPPPGQRLSPAQQRLAANQAEMEKFINAAPDAVNQGVINA